MYIHLNNNTGLCVAAVLSHNESTWLLHVHSRQTLRVTEIHQNKTSNQHYVTLTILLLFSDMILLDIYNIIHCMKEECVK